MTTFQEPSTIGEFNTRLRALSIDARLTPESLKGLYAQVAREDKPGRERVLDALRRAEDIRLPGSLNAKDFLTKVIANAYSACNEAPRTSTAAAVREPVQERHTRESQPSNVAQFNRRERQSGRDAEPSADSTYDPDHVAANEPESGRSDAERSDTRNTGSVPRLQVKAFGKSAALCVESDITRRNVPTVRFELAEGVGEKQFDWKNKLIVQLTQDEIIETTAALFGFVKKVEFKNHGEDGKWLSIERQGQTTLIRGGGGNRKIRLLPINAGRTTALAALLLAQVDKSLFGVGDFGALLPLLSRVTGEMLSAPPFQRANHAAL